MSLAATMMDRVERTGGCWRWTGGHNGWGRPYLKNKLVYRVLYEFFRGPIPKGLVLDHEKCDNPSCVNPWHLSPKTQRENLVRAGVTKNLGNHAAKGNELAHLRVNDSWMDRTRDNLGRFTSGG